MGVNDIVAVVDVAFTADASVILRSIDCLISGKEPKFVVSSQELGAFVRL